MSFPVVYPPPPNQTDFTAFLRVQAGIPVAALPDSSPYIPDALELALNIVNQALNQAAPNLYTLAVYNLATDRLINFAPDQNQTIVSLTWAAGVVTVVVTNPLPGTLPLGQEFNTVISGAVPTGYNATVSDDGAVVVGGSSFTYPLATNPGAETTPGAYLLPFFQMLRANWNINTSVAGVVQSSSDQSTSVGLDIPEQLKALTLADIQKLKTPFGRTYLEIAQAYGQTLFGVS